MDNQIGQLDCLFFPWKLLLEEVLQYLKAQVPHNKAELAGLEFFLVSSQLEARNAFFSETFYYSHCISSLLVTFYVAQNRPGFSLLAILYLLY